MEFSVKEFATLAQELLGWLYSLDMEFAFLLALPFLVAATAFLSGWFRNDRHQRSGSVDQPH
jgi:hypothetical protein